MDISSYLWVTAASPTGHHGPHVATAPGWGPHSDNNKRAELRKHHVVHNPQALLLSLQIYISLEKKKRVCGSPHTRPETSPTTSPTTSMAISALGGHS